MPHHSREDYAAIIESIVDRSRDLHDKAIALSERADALKIAGDHSAYASLMEAASEMEAGASSVALIKGRCRTAGILYASAAEMAIEATRRMRAKRYAELSLTADPSGRVAGRAREIYSYRIDPGAQKGRDRYHIPLYSSPRNHHFKQIVGHLENLSAVAYNIAVNRSGATSSEPANSGDWRTHYAIGNFYSAVRDEVPDESVTRTASMNAASPGWIEIEMPEYSLMWISSMFAAFETRGGAAENALNEGYALLKEMRPIALKPGATNKRLSLDSSASSGNASEITCEFLETESAALRSINARLSEIFPEAGVESFVDVHTEPVRAHKLIRSFLAHIERLRNLSRARVAIF